MAGIFDLFGDFAESNKNSSVSAHPAKSMRSKSSIRSNELPLKQNNGSTLKAKGLSMRSNSDINIASHSQDLTENKKQKKIPEKYLNSVPSKEKFSSFKKPGLLENKVTESSDKLNKTHQNTNLFKKPKPIEKSTKIIKVEQLAPYCDMDYELNKINLDLSLENDIKELLSKMRNFTEDEGFESDPEIMPVPNIPLLSTTDISNKSINFTITEEPELPEISDDDLDL